MCGIVGIRDFQGTVDRRDLERLRDRLAHRGPDGAGLYVSADRQVGLGHRRLTIIDLSAAGSQPMGNEDGTIWTTFNGEIYNYQGIAATLRDLGHRFASHCDTEVIVHGYEQWGIDVVQRFAGMFAFAVWDEPLRLLHLVRDRVGIKPLYYYFDGSLFVFASEIKGIIVHPGVRRDLDDSAIYDYLTYLYVPTPKTCYRYIRKLPPGHTLTLNSEGGLQVNQYWDLDLSRPSAAADAGTKLVGERFEEAVGRTLVSDVPVGIFLSGGMDSSSITSVAARLAREPIKTFSIDFDVAAHSEIEHARLVASSFGTEHHERVVSLATMKEMLSRIPLLYDEPFADASAVPTYCVCELARQEVKAVIGGDGGDELFAGYKWYDSWMALRRYDSLVRLLGRPAFRRLHSLMPRGVKGKHLAYLLSLPLVEQYAPRLAAFTPVQKRSILSEGFGRQFADYDDYWFFRSHWREGLDPITQVQYLDLKTYLPDDILTKVDRVSMAQGLEVRVPFLEHDLIQACFSLPGDLRYRNGEKKHVLKSLMRGRIPAQILDRPKKGFSPPLSRWLQEPGLVEECNRTGRAVERGILKDGAVKGLVEKGGTVNQIWSLIVLEQWLGTLN